MKLLKKKQTTKRGRNTTRWRKTPGGKTEQEHFVGSLQSLLLFGFVVCFQSPQDSGLGGGWISGMSSSTAGRSERHFAWRNLAWLCLLVIHTKYWHVRVTWWGRGAWKTSQVVYRLVLCFCDYVSGSPSPGVISLGKGKYSCRTERGVREVNWTPGWILP